MDLQRAGLHRERARAAPSASRSSATSCSTGGGGGADHGMNYRASVHLRGVLRLALLPDSLSRRCNSASGNK